MWHFSKSFPISYLKGSNKLLQVFLYLYFFLCNFFFYKNAFLNLELTKRIFISFCFCNYLLNDEKDLLKRPLSKAMYLTFTSSLLLSAFDEKKCSRFEYVKLKSVCRRVPVTKISKIPSITLNPKDFIYQLIL